MEQNDTVRAIHYSNFPREPGDFYATPDWVTEALLRHVRLRGPVWEPCCGTGDMAEVLSRHGHAVVATDVADHGYGTPGIDIFGCTTYPGGCRSLVTNPPYGDGGSLADRTRSPAALLRFVRHTLALAEAAQGQAALLVRLQWIAGQRAAALLSSGPFVATIVLTRRIRWFDRGELTNSGQHHHAWVVFDYAEPPGGAPQLLFAG